MTEKRDPRTAPAGEALLLRFGALVLAVVAAVVALFTVDAAWMLVLAVIVLVGMLAATVAVILRYVSEDDDAFPAEQRAADEPSRSGDVEQPVAVEGSLPDGTRVLVLAGDAAPSLDEVPAGIRTLLGEADSVLVVAPILAGRCRWLTSDTDAARADAQLRLATVLDQLHRAGIAAAGVVGDDEPLTAAGDGVRRFAPHEVVVALRNQARAGWQERGLTEAIGEDLGVAVSSFEVRR